jgi:glycosyltransferase involved in cell wall biosynthesis
MSTKLVIDGSLLAECEMAGTSRGGAHRVAEEVTKKLINIGELEISFANTVYTRQHDEFLRKYISANYPLYASKVISRKPFIASSIPKWGGLLGRLGRGLSLEVKVAGVEKFDVFHSFYHPFPRSIRNKGIKKSITLLDIIALRMSGYSPALIDVTRKIIDSIVPNFAISISEFSKQDLIDYDRRIRPERVFVAPPAASREKFFQNRNSGAWRAIKDKYKLPDSYFLSVSSNDRRKNLPHLIRSFSKFVLQEKPQDLYLVLTGNSTHGRFTVDELNIKGTARNRIIVTDRHIDDEDLSAIYSHSLCFFFMSLYEGFGLPALEAMQCGVPVVTSNTTSLPEVVGDAGITLSPTDEDALCGVMNEVYHSEELRDRYSRSGLERAKQFSWQRCAEEYTNIFRRIASDS